MTIGLWRGNFIVDVVRRKKSSVVVLEESPCPRGSSRTIFQVVVLVLVLKSQVLDNNTGEVVVSFYEVQETKNVKKYLMGSAGLFVLFQVRWGMSAKNW